MRETMRRFRCEAGRFKFVAAVAGIFLSGSLIALGAASWYYGSILDKRIAAYDRQVSRLMSDVDEERQVNRAQLRKIADQSMSNAKKLDEIAETARNAASTAKSAATTARGAANNAARAQIKITEVPAKPVKPARPIKQPRVEP